MVALDPKLTFDSFVIGPANRLACAAARRAAESPGESYNPLFIYSASGLGKSHILCAIANFAEASEGTQQVMYQPLEDYLDSLTRSLEAGTRDELRDRYRELDILLLDDVQFLTGQTEAQEMLLTTLDVLTQGGSQVVLASDRPPAEIDGLDARLVSRFSGGLIVDLSAPELETRIAIIRRKTAEAEQTVVEGVAEAVARAPFKNVRELAGALNKILAIQDLEGRQVKPKEIRGILGLRPERSKARPSEPQGDDDFSTFLDEISAELAQAVEEQEAEWRSEVRVVAEAAEREGFAAGRLRSLLQADVEPPEWKSVLVGYEVDLTRLREIEEVLEELDNPWPDLAEDLIRDPDQMGEAESFLESVRERRRPFGRLRKGPLLGDLESAVPHLVLRAAEQLATGEKPKYNPLYLWSPEEAAPHAVLGATYRTFTTAFPELVAAVVSVSAFAEDFVRALSDGVAGAWRERWWTVDLLLVHGAEGLALTERAQDEFFHLFEALKRRGSRVVIGADREPSRIESIDDRLRSRFEGGLVLEVESTSDLPAGSADLSLVDLEPKASVVADPIRSSVAATTAQVREPARIATSAAARGAWVPSREKVVWNWADLDARLVDTEE